MLYVLYMGIWFILLTLTLYKSLTMDDYMVMIFFHCIFDWPNLCADVGHFICACLIELIDGKYNDSVVSIALLLVTEIDMTTTILLVIMIIIFILIVFVYSL